MENFMYPFFGPLDKSACFYFLIISIIFFISLILVLGSEIIYILQNLNRINFKVVSSGVIVMFNIFVAYFVNRLLYTICTKSLA